MLQIFDRLYQFFCLLQEEDPLPKIMTPPSAKDPFLYKLLKILLFSFREFFKDQCVLRASALTYYTLLGIVPLLAMAFGFAKGFAFEKHLEDEIMALMHGHVEIASNSIVFARNMLEQTKGGLIAGIGILSLFWSILKILGHIEEAFNQIYSVSQSRSWARKVSDYLSISLICPLLFLFASSLSLFLISEMQWLVESLQSLGSWSRPLITLIDFLPILSIWALFTFLYMAMPNTDVSFFHAFLASVVAGSLFQLVQHLILYFQVGISHYGTIYGSFAAFPLFLIWLQTSWLIILFGCELAYMLKKTKEL